MYVDDLQLHHQSYSAKTRWVCTFLYNLLHNNSHVHFWQVATVTMPTFKASNNRICNSRSSWCTKPQIEIILLATLSICNCISPSRTLGH